MKPSMKSVAMIVFSAAVPFTAIAGEGSSSGTRGGGNSYAAHFAEVGTRLSGAFELICKSPRPNDAQICKVRQDFSDAVNSALILPRDTLVGQDGKPREAGPDGKGNIELNVPRYKELIKKTEALEPVAALVAHEYMIIARQESDDSYVTSAILIGSLRANFIDLSALVGAPPAPPAPVVPPASSIKQCSGINLRQAPEGTICKTSARVTFQLVKRTPGGFEVWRDQLTGYLWSDTLNEKYTLREAVEICQKFESIAPRGDLETVAFGLPNDKIFETAERHGFREVLPRMEGNSFWSSSLGDFYSDLSHTFKASKGRVVTDDGGATRNSNSVRCVGGW